MHPSLFLCRAHVGPSSLHAVYTHAGGLEGAVVEFFLVGDWRFSLLTGCDDTPLIVYCAHTIARLISVRQRQYITVINAISFLEVNIWESNIWEHRTRRYKPPKLAF